MIRWILTNFAFTTLVTGLIIGILCSSNKTVMTDKLRAIIINIIFFNIGLGNLHNFIPHAFFGDEIAKFIGWQNSPFQLEVAFASLGLTLGAFWAFRRGFEAWVTIFLAYAGFLWGAAGGHIYQIVLTQNFAPGNAGSVFYMDIISPLVLLLLLIAYKISSTKIDI